MNGFELARAYITTLTGSPNTVCDFRIINDRNAAEQAINMSGDIARLYNVLKEYNDKGYGIFMNVNAMKPNCRSKTLENVDFIRAQVADIDDPMTSQDSYNRAVSSNLPPHFAVQSSTGKFHLYWLVEPYIGNDFYELHQRKICQLYNGDKHVVDATRVLRVPGFMHCKGEPHQVMCWAIHNRPRYTSQQIADGLNAVNVVSVASCRKPLGDETMKAPSLEWLNFALNLTDPNELAREDWLGLSAAFKQAGWSLTTEQVLLEMWQTWCAKYKDNNVGENLKLWNSIKDSEVGWMRFERLTNVKAYFNNNPAHPPVQKIAPMTIEQPTVNVPVQETQDVNDVEDVILDTFGKQKWFKNCYFVEREGKIFSPTGRFMNQTQFNGRYGGKEFCTRVAGGKITDEAWKAALRSTDWTIPKVDHIRFLPQHKPFEIITDDLGRKGLNTYIPAIIKAVEGDVTPWTDYLTKIFNTPEDVKIFEDYIAHCIKFPGWKIPWTVLLQSAKGVGKQMIANVIKYAIGESYTYQPDAEELVSGVSQFNGWMRNKLMIIVDEVRVGDRNDLMNGLKTIITDRRIAIESKGVDQEMEDNVSNWIFFSNFKDAFPIDENERRYCIFFSKLQTAEAIKNAGLTKEYFDKMYYWLEREDGYKKLAHYYQNYPLEKGNLSHRAPQTSSYAEVLRIGRSPLRVILDEKIEAGERGFRAGYVSFTMFQKAVADSSMRSKPAEHTLRNIIEQRGFVELGRTKEPVPGEDLTHPSWIFGLKGLKVEDYERSQM